MAILDVTVPIRTGMITFEGDAEVHVERIVSIAAGGVCNLSRADLGLHSGTHIDAPLHYIDGAAGVEETPLDALMGSVFVLDATAMEGNIDEAALRQLAIPADAERLLFKTKNCELWARVQFSREFIGITEDGALALAARGTRLVGVDYLSVAPFGNPAPTHVALLSAGVIILEGLDLRQAESGWYELLCLPLLIDGADGAPARALLMKE